MKRVIHLFLVLFIAIVLVGCTCPHEYTEKVIAPTCTENGYTEYTCTVCKYVYTENEVEATGHKYGEWKIIKNATEEEKGLKEKVEEEKKRREEEQRQQQLHQQQQQGGGNYTSGA